MGSFSSFFVASGRIFLGWAHVFRGRAIRFLIAVESHRDPQNSVRWLLGLHDDLGYAIDEHCVRWGNGIHIKHDLMEGIHSFFIQNIEQDSCVLDVGCGIGAVAHAIASAKKGRVIGVDLNEASIAFAKKHFQLPNLEFRVMDATRDSMERKVDVVVLSSLLEHIDDRIGLLKDLISTVQPRVVLVRVPMLERHYFTALKLHLRMFAYTDPTHRVEYTIAGFKMEMDAAGLTIDEMTVRWGDLWAVCRPVVRGGVE
jgi:ubiquinone/menaquinone biosynthesis C-methylase UbiE